MIASVIKKVPKKILGIKTEVLVVNDGSKDKTEFKAKQAGAFIINHSINRGLGQTFQTGIEKAIELDADIMVNIDADGQFNPKEISKLIAPIINKEANFVASDRFYNLESNNLVKPHNMPLIKYWGNLLMANLISFLSNQKFNDVSCGFRAYDRKTLLSLNLIGKFTYTQESFLDLATKGLRIKTVPVNVKYFTDRKSRVAIT